MCFNGRTISNVALGIRKQVQKRRDARRGGSALNLAVLFGISTTSNAASTDPVETYRDGCPLDPLQEVIFGLGRTSSDIEIHHLVYHKIVVLNPVCKRQIFAFSRPFEKVLVLNTIFLPGCVFGGQFDYFVCNNYIFLNF